MLNAEYWFGILHFALNILHFAFFAFLRDLCVLLCSRGQWCCCNGGLAVGMITCSLLFDRHRGSGEIIFPKRWGQTKLRDGRRAQGTNGRVPFVINRRIISQSADLLLLLSSEVFLFLSQ
jgi:hypothetical protein